MDEAAPAKQKRCPVRASRSRFSPPRHGFYLEDYMSPECALMSVEFLFSRADLKQSSRYRRQTLCLEVCCCCDVQGHSDGEGMSLVLASLSSAFYTCDSKIL